MAIIYYIDNEKNWKGYIGCSKNSLSHRWGQHKYLLRRGIHPNLQLQEDWNKYGADSFGAFVLETCSDEDMLNREKYHINRLKTNIEEIGYNQK